MSDSDIGIQLELKDRLNYSAYIQKFLELTQTLNSKIDIPTKVTQQVMMDFLQSIPDTWKDKEFLEDLKGVIKEEMIDNRTSYCGVPLSLEYYRKKKIQPVKKVKRVNYYKLKSALINLLDRRQMLIRKEKIESSTGRNLDYETLEDFLAEMKESDIEGEIDDEDIE